jgi:hypothetical protein
MKFISLHLTWVLIYVWKLLLNKRGSFLNTNAFCYKTNICFNNMLHVSTLKNQRQLWVYKKDGSFRKTSSDFIIKGSLLIKTTSII